MYTVKELSETLNLSQTATYNWLKHKQVKKFTFKQNGKTLVNPEVVGIIQGLKEVEKTNGNESEKEKEYISSNDYYQRNFNASNELIFHLKEELKNKNDQIMIKDEQLKTKDEQITNLIRLNENSQVLLKDQQNKVQLLEDKRNKKPFWKIF